MAARVICHGPSRRVSIASCSGVAMVSSSDVQRLFLQSAISRRVLSADLAKALWKQSVEAVKGTLLYPFRLYNVGLNMMVTPAVDDTLQINANTNSADGWSDFLASLNKSLDPLDLELSRMRNEITGKDMYALVIVLLPSVTVS